jgi:hypothetical protein
VAAIDAVWRSLTATDKVTKLVKAATDGGLGGPPALCRVFSVLGEAGVYSAVEACTGATTKELREALLELLGRTAPDFPDALARLLQPTVDAATAKWALFLVSKKLKGPVAQRLYLLGAQHPAEPVSTYANFLYRTQTEKGRLQAFQESLDAPDQAERARALDAVVRSRDLGAFEALKAAVEAPGFLGRSSDERRAFLNAVAAMGGKGAIGFLSRQVERRTSVLKPGATREIRAFAEELVQKLGSAADEDKGLARPPNDASNSPRPASGPWWTK